MGCIHKGPQFLPRGVASWQRKASLWMERLILLLTPWLLKRKNVFGKDGIRWRIAYGASSIVARVPMFHYEGEAGVSGML